MYACMHIHLSLSFTKVSASDRAYPTVSRAAMTAFRGFIMQDDVEAMRSAVEANPYTLVTSSDTPILLQVIHRSTFLVHTCFFAKLAESVEHIISFFCPVIDRVLDVHILRADSFCSGVLITVKICMCVFD